MNKKSYFIIYFIIFLNTILVAQVIYLNSSKSNNKQILKMKNDLVKIVQLPDLAICTEATYIRHRSLSDLNSVYKDDPTLREYFPSAFVYNHSNLYKNISTSKVINVK
jgi:predicted permease